MKQRFNIVVPMAGRGSRFTEQGYTDSKPFIDVNGKPMIQRVIENLNIEFDSNYEFIIICLQEDYDKYDFTIFDNIIGHTEYKVICLEDVTEGAAQTLLESKSFINNNTPMLSFNTDQMIDYNPEKMWELAEHYDGYIPCFWGDSEDWSYAKTSDNGYVEEIAEKKVISNNATAGYYYWKKGSDFVKYAEQMIEQNSRTNGEFYVAPVYNWAIKDGKKICIGMVDKIYELGTPEYLEEYLNGNKISDVLTSKGSNIGIVYTMKQGCSSLKHLQGKFSDTFEIVEKNLTDKNFTFVIPIRSPYEKWVSGVIQELDVGRKEDVFKRWVDSDEQIEEILEKFIKIGLSNIRKPMALYHSKLGKWTVNDEISLFQYTKMKNIYFVELKEFSNPNFIEWMRQRDKNWSVVDEIPKKNVTNNSDWKQFVIKAIKNTISKSKETDDIIFNIFYRQDEDYNFGNHYHKRNDFVAFEEILERYFFLEETIFEEIKKSDRFIELEPYEKNV